MTARKTPKRIINVSNRLPIKICKTGNIRTYVASEGGLATGLNSVFSGSEHLWIGWPGAVVSRQEQNKVTADLEARHLVPVYLSEYEIDKFYEGFSNGTIWPLFHYFPSYSNFDPECWEAYVAVNRKFADEILSYASADDVIWIHDYQLMLVPGMVREEMPDATIGYFQHIPFPSYELFKTLPWKKEIINGLLGADTVGFQTEEDAEYFCQTAKALLSYEHEEHTIKVGVRNVLAKAFPISIDYMKFRDMATHAETKMQEKRIEELLDTKMLISVDRLDYSKGILQRLKAYDLFLQKYPEYHQEVSLIHLIVPSRDNVCKYKELKEEMNKLVSEINGKYATFGWQPIHHFYRSLSPNMLSALYKKADVALVTPIRDGMNLVCKEYVASNIGRNGVLVLSEAAGAAKELQDAIQVNPHDIEGYAEAIHQALVMPSDEKAKRMRAMQRHIEGATIFHWMESFVQTLETKEDQQSLYICTQLNDAEKDSILRHYAQAEQRLIMLDYDGTLMPFSKKPELANPDRSLLRLLGLLARDENNKVVVISGRDRQTLERWIGHMQLDIIAEHGIFYKQAGKGWLSIPGLQTDWKNSIMKLLVQFANKVPGSFIEEKSYSLVWHYRNSEHSVVVANLPAIISQMRTAIAGKELAILDGDKVIEIKSSYVNKGKAAEALMAKNNYNFILAAGDDVTDEDMFKALSENAITIKVGSNISAAKLYVPSYKELRILLSDLSTISIEPNNRLLLAS